MKKLISSGGYLFSVDIDNNTVKKQDRDRTGLDALYMIDEDQTLYIQNGDTIENVPVKKGDILVTFYDSDFPNKYVIIESDKWTENLVAERKAEQKRKEEWAAKQASNDERRPAAPDCTVHHCND